MPTDFPTTPLAPCPFCGLMELVVHTQHRNSRPEGPPGAWRANVRCYYCEAEGPYTWGGSREAVHARATELWNRRATPTQQEPA